MCRIVVYVLLVSVQLLSFSTFAQQTGAGATDSNCVVINEIVHKPRSTEEDWMELYNSCSESVNLANYLIRDSTTATFIMGQGTCVHQILPRSYLLLMRRQNCSFEFGLGGDDSVHLFNPLGDEIDSTTWVQGAAPEGKSWARLPNGGGPFITSDPTPGEFNGFSLVLPDKIVTSIKEVTVVINEAVSKPVELEEDWIELYNYGTTAVNLKGLRLTDKKQAPGDGFYFGEEGCEDVHIIGPSEYLVMEKNLGCSFEFGLGDSDELVLWFDEEAYVDKVQYGPEFAKSLVPTGVSWGRLPNGDKNAEFKTLQPTKGSPNQVVIDGIDLAQLIVAMVQSG